ncbi:MAG: succinate dehydrogenase, cytochrome b556 subunit [Chromatocurvus sp.]
MKDNRPVNLDIGSMRLPITAWASITHRASGVFLFAASVLMLWALDVSLRSPESFARLAQLLSSGFAKSVIWVVATGLLYHSIAGIRHLIMDFGIGESMPGGVLGARLVMGVTVVLSLIMGVWLW